MTAVGPGVNNKSFGKCTISKTEKSTKLGAGDGPGLCSTSRTRGDLVEGIPNTRAEAIENDLRVGADDDVTSSTGLKRK